MVFAHFGARGTAVLNMPAWAVAYGIFAAGAITMLWSRSRHVESAPPSVVAPSAPGSGARPPTGRATVVIRWAADVVTAVAFWSLTAFCWFGPASIAQNVAPLALVGVAWGMGGGLALLAGPLWWALDPFALAARIAERRGPRSSRVPSWVPAAVFVAYVVVWVAWTRGDDPRHLAVWLTGYGIVMVGIAWQGGTAALRAANPLPVALDLTGAIFHRRRARAGTVERRGRLRTETIAIGVLAAVAADRTATAAWFVTFSADHGEWVDTLVVMAMFVGYAVGIGALWRVVQLPVERARSARGAHPLGADLAPVAGSVLLATGIPVGLIQAQNLAVLASDPFAQGWDLFGTVYWQVSLQPVSAFALGLIQGGVLLVGHCAAVLAVGRSATDRFADGRSSPRARYRAWNAALPALCSVVLGGAVWTVYLLGR